MKNVFLQRVLVGGTLVLGILMVGMGVGCAQQSAVRQPEALAVPSGVMVGNQVVAQAFLSNGEMGPGREERYVEVGRGRVSTYRAYNYEVERTGNVGFPGNWGVRQRWDYESGTSNR